MSSCAVPKNVDNAVIMLIFTINGIEVKATSAAEAAELIKALGKPIGAATETARAMPITPKSSRADRFKLRLRSRRNGANVRTVAVEFLSKIRDAGSEGIAADGLMDILGARHPKGIGSRSAPVNKLIESLGYDIEDVYDNPRSPEGRIWKPGPKMDAAIEALKKGT